MKQKKQLLLILILLFCSAIGYCDEIITFADSNVEAICVAKWDTSGDGKLSKAEAAAVTALGAAFKKNNEITSFNELQYFTGLTKLDKWAFGNCHKLTSVTLPSTITEIDENAFTSSGLTAFNIPASVTAIGESAFAGCQSLTAFTVDAGNNSFTVVDGILYNKEKTILINCPAGKSTTATLPETVQKIEANGFYDCVLLPGIILPASLQEIGPATFTGCSSLTSLNIPANVNKIETGNFTGCTALETITVEAGNQYYQSIGGVLYSKDVTKLIAYPNMKGTSYIVPDGTVTIDDYAFCMTGIETLTLPATVQKVGDYALGLCASLSELKVNAATPGVASSNSFTGTPSTVKLIVPVGSKDAYQDADYWNVFTNIEEMSALNDIITFTDENVKAICVVNWDTSGDGKLSKAEAAAVTALGAAFKKNNEITSFNELQYFTGLTKLDKWAFGNCHKLTSVTLPSTITEIDENAFTSSGLTAFNIPASVTAIGESAFAGCQSLTAFTVDAGNNSFTVVDGILYNKEKTILINCPAGKSTTATLPETVQKIEANGFYDCVLLPGIILPASLQEIGPATFTGCSSLTSLNIPANVNKIETGNFTGCTALETITVEAGNLYYQSIGGVLYSKDGTKLIAYPNKKGTSYIVPDGTLTIDDYAFCMTGIETLTLPATIQKVGDYALGLCASLSELRVNAATPGVASSNSFTRTPSTVKLIVPAGSKDAYQNADYWNVFTNIEEMSALNDGDTFEATVGETTFKIKVLSTADKTCQIGADKTGANGNMVGSDAIVSSSRNWDGVIPSKVTGSDGQEYTVIGIGNRAFKEYGSITTVILPNTLQYISEGAFMRMESLMYFTIPAGLKTVGGLLFNGQEILTEVVSMIEDPDVINDIDIDCGGRYGNNATLVVPAGTKNIYQNADGWNHFPRIVEMKVGDANGDGTVDLQDVEIVKEFIMTGRIPEGFVRHNADTNGDKKINVADIVNIVNEIPTK